MRKIGAMILASMLLVWGMTGCGGQQQATELVDGTYTAEFKEYDSYGYKDYVRVTVEGGVVTQVEYNGVNADGDLKTADEKYQSDMEKTQDTYPARYTADLANQLLEKGTIDQVDDIAGATWSSECFKALYKALAADNMVTGSTETLLVDNVPEK